MKNTIKRALTWLAVIAIVLLVSYNYYSYTTDLINKNASSQLLEIYSETGESFEQSMHDGWGYMHNWASYLSECNDEDQKGFIERTRDVCQFTDFYFADYLGNYYTPDGATGSLNIDDQLIPLFVDQSNISTYTQLDESSMNVLIVPCSTWYYNGFEYHAIAVSYDEEDMLKFFANTSYNSVSDNCLVETDGNAIMNNNNRYVSGDNFLESLANSSNLSSEQLLTMQKNISMDQSGVVPAVIDSEPVYIVYQPLTFNDWCLIGVVPQSSINSDMTRMQFSTLMVCSGLLAMICLIAGFFISQRNKQILKYKDAELKYQDACFESLSRNTDDVFLTLNQKDLSVNYVTPNVEDVLGIPETDVRKDVHEIDRIVRKECDVDILSQLQTLGIDQSAEWDIIYRNPVTEDLQYFHLLGLCKEISGISRYIVVFSNRTKEITANIAMQDALNEANRASQAKSLFLSNMSHDIRTPMNAILGYTALARNRINDPIKLENYLSKITSSGNYLLSLINDILDMSRIESGKVQLDETETDLNEMIDRIFTIIDGQIREKHLHLIRDVQIVNSDIICDKTRLNQIFINLLANAIKFTDDEGEIQFRVHQESSSDPERASYEIHIQDNGRGISEEFISHVFEPFEREDKGASETLQGTGLGLSITKSIVDMMKGTIEVFSKQGEGTEFVIHLSFRINNNVMKIPSEKVVSKQKLTFDNHLLIVEDNMLNREIAVEILKEYGFTLDTASNGQEALDKLNSHPDRYDLVLMDIQMPVMDGLTCARNIRSSHNEKLRSIPIVAMTANAFEEDHQKALAAGMNDFLTKPIHPEELIRILHNLLH